MIEFDLILDKVGHLGRYQIILILLAYWLGIPAGMHSLASVFYAANVPYRCSVPPLDNTTAYPNLTESDILNYTTPYNGHYETCERYGFNLSACQPQSLSCVNTSYPPINCDLGYHFDTYQFASTVNTEWNLICGRRMLGTLATSIYFAGMWSGAVFFGYLADRIGRRNTMLLASVGCLLSGIGIAIAPWFEVFVVLRFFVAAFSHGCFLIMFVYVVEISGSHRTLTGVHVHTAFAAGFALNSLVSYYLRYWRRFYFVISLTPVPFFIIYFFLPDSPRWHFSNGRDEIGKKLSQKFAKHNHATITESDWLNATVSQTGKKLAENTYSSLDLFKTKRMRLITLNSMFNWMVISMVYYGLGLNAGSLAGSVFINNALNAVMELVGFLIIQFTMDRWGRRFILVFMMILQGVACLLSTLLTTVANGNQVAITIGVASALVGKIGSGGAFAVIYNYTAELYPTVIRGNALGIGSMAARVGSIFSPFIIVLQDYVSWLPTTIFGILSIIAGLLALAFPETMHHTMLQTMDEAELFYRGKKTISQKNDESNLPVLEESTALSTSII